MAKCQLLKQFFSLELLMLTSVYWPLIQECNADASWNSFALCSSCIDKRLVVPENLFQPRLIGKGSSLIWVRMDCSHSCANQDSCYAFNLFENEDFYVCELLSNNLHRNRTALQLIDHPGCSAWEKLNTGLDLRTTELSTKSTPGASTAMTLSSTTTSPKSSTLTTSSSAKISTSLSTGIAVPTTDMTPLLCAAVRPGCLGAYPNCYNCIKTCIDYMARDDLTDPLVYLWPDGDGPDSLPIRAECDISSIILIERNLNLSSGAESKKNVMSFYDMHRLFQLNAYPVLRFQFRTTNNSRVTINSRKDTSDYKNVIMSPNGTLSNLTYYSSYGATVDIFNLKGQPMKSTPFINVTNDRYGCGSFWLLDATNATYCPGGAAGMFGTLKTNGTRVVNTGIRLPTNFSGIVFYVRVFLSNPTFYTG